MEYSNLKKPISLTFLTSINNSNSTPNHTNVSGSDPYKNLPNMGTQQETNKITINSSNPTSNPKSNSIVPTKYNIPPIGTERNTWFAWYNEYLQTDHWTEVRRFALKRDKNRCRTCSCSGTKTNPLQIHHSRYSGNQNSDGSTHVLFHEMDDDTCIITLCKRCHKGIHRIIKKT